jgi:hypothetical protein
MQGYLLCVNKLDYLKETGDEIVAAGVHELTATAMGILDALADEWGYPRYLELGRYQLRFGSSGGGEVGYSLRDKESAICVSGKGRNDVAARSYCLYLIRLATNSVNRDLCWPKGGSLHSPMCTCPKSRDPEGNMRIGCWDEDDDFEKEL